MESSSPSAQQIQAIFDRIAPVYDHLNDWLSLGQHRIWKQMAVKWSKAFQGAVCLDVCCGSGDLTQLLAQQVGKQGQVFGVDFSPVQLAIAQERSCRRPQLLPIHWVQGDALNLPFDTNYFDAATMGYGLRNVIDIPGSLRELHRILKPGATVAILDFHRPQSFILRAAQTWYLQNVVVPLAQHYNLTEEYTYLSPSIDRFPTGVGQVQLARQAGFSTVVHYPIASGMMGVLVATK